MIDRIGAMPIERMPFMKNTTKSTSNLSEREKEIFNQISDKIASQYGVPVKINHGNKGESGLTVAITGMVGSVINGQYQAEVFLITPQMLKEMAESEAGYNKWMDNFQESIDRQIDLGMVFPVNRNATEENEADRLLEEIKANMMSALDFWNQHNDGSWHYLGQGQAVQQKLGVGQ